MLWGNRENGRIGLLTFLFILSIMGIVCGAETRRCRPPKGGLALPGTVAVFGAEACSRFWL
jgi:hypothetical protein